MLGRVRGRSELRKRIRIAGQIIIINKNSNSKRGLSQRSRKRIQESVVRSGGFFCKKKKEKTNCVLIRRKKHYYTSHHYHQHHHQREELHKEVYDQMKDEISAASDFLTRLVGRQNHHLLDEEKLSQFRSHLDSVLHRKFTNHWFPEKPSRGQAFRCIRVNENIRRDSVLETVCHEIGISYTDLIMPTELTLWIDPEEVTCRFGEHKGSYCIVAQFKDGNKENYVDTIDVEELEQKSLEANKQASFEMVKNKKRRDCRLQQAKLQQQNAAMAAAAAAAGLSNGIVGSSSPSLSSSSSSSTGLSSQQQQQQQHGTTTSFPVTSVHMNANHHHPHHPHVGSMYTSDAYGMAAAAAAAAAAAVVASMPTAAVSGGPYYGPNPMTAAATFYSNSSNNNNNHNNNTSPKYVPISSYSSPIAPSITRTHLYKK